VGNFASALLGRFRSAFTGVVVAVADAADRGHDPGLGEAFGVADREILDAAVAVMNDTISG
jgi:hypothetical protein